MVTEIVEVLVKITEMIKKNQSEDKIAEFVIKDPKYNKNIIAAAYSWIHEKSRYNETNNSKLTSNSKSFRSLSSEEVSQIGVHNYNYLLHFYNIELLTNHDYEDIIEQLKLFPEDSINPEQINLLILALFLDIDKLTLPGSRQILYSSDTIN